VTRQQKRTAGKRKRAAVVSKLSFDSLTPGDWSVICACLIHERDNMFASANDEDGSRSGDHTRAATFDSKGWRINEVLIQLKHPAALEGPMYDVRCPKCGARDKSQLRSSIGGACPADKRSVETDGPAGLHEWGLYKKK